MNPSAASSRIASATWNVALTMIVPIVFGMMCRSTMRALPPPMTRTASTYSRTRSDSVSPRTSRAGTSHAVRPITRIRISSDGWKITARTITRKRIGTESRTSTMRIIRASTQPPKKPGDRAEQHTDDRGDRGCGEPDLERDLTPVHDPAEHVEAALVRAEQVGRARRRVLRREEEGVLGAALVRVVEDGAHEAEEHHADDDHRRRRSRAGSRRRRARAASRYRRSRRLRRLPARPARASADRPPADRLPAARYAYRTRGSTIA